MDLARATPAERASSLPGDDLVAADVVMDRGFDLGAPPSEVWPWLVQLGKRRAGWYLPRSVEVLVPPGIDVEVDASTFMGNVEDRTERSYASGNVVRIVGRVKLGNLEVSTRRPGETRRDARRRRRADRRARRYWRRALPSLLD